MAVSAPGPRVSEGDESKATTIIARHTDKDCSCTDRMI
jgi:hypothetical protein